MRFNLNKNIFFLAAITLFIALTSLSSCIDETFSDNTSYKLTFSTDTLLFDTVFTTVGSATKQIIVYNPNNKNLKIASISLGMGRNSQYRLNVDGQVSEDNNFKDIEIRAKDSLYIFVEVTVDPQAKNSPVFVKDSIVFNTNTNLQDVKLISYGQNMEVLTNKEIMNDTTLTADKPYVIHGYLYVDSAKTLTLAPGCRLYFHSGANLIVYGNLIAEGTREKPILLRGDRLDDATTNVTFPYNYISNQWGSIYLLNPNGHHKLNFVNLRSGYVGLYFYNKNKDLTPTMEITNSKIDNFLKYGIVVVNGNVTVGNSEISNTGGYSVYLNGGKHTFVQTTIANYFNNSGVLLQPNSRESESACMIYELDKPQRMETTFENCIIAGSTTNEFDIFSSFPANYNGVFKNSYIKNYKPDIVTPQFSDIRWYEKGDTLIFKNVYYDSLKLVYYNFQLDSLSPARNIGDVNVAAQYPYDLNGNSRLADGKPDAGAYEWQPTK